VAAGRRTGTAVKAIVRLLLTISLAMGIIALCVFAADDRQTFVPPPEAIGEGFLRQMTARRYDRVEQYFSRARHEWTAGALRRQFDPLWRRTGTINQVDAELVSIEEDRASVVATARGDDGDASVRFSLTREQGLWRVDGISFR
jgi:hypothetical protein